MYLSLFVTYYYVTQRLLLSLHLIRCIFFSICVASCYRTLYEVSWVTSG